MLIDLLTWQLNGHTDNSASAVIANSIPAIDYNDVISGGIKNNNNNNDNNAVISAVPPVIGKNLLVTDGNSLENANNKPVNNIAVVSNVTPALSIPVIGAYK